MAVHKVGLKIAHELPISSTDIELPVHRDNAPLGVVRISKGGIDWKKAHAQKSHKLTWAQFDELMRAHGKRSP